jgi:RHS repeat-associated protein
MSACAATPCRWLEFHSSSRYPGKERDTESGNDYFGARYYASSMGRFMSPDWSKTPQGVPYADLTNPQSLNLYQYMRNNPLGGVDKDGHCPGWLQGVCNLGQDIWNAATGNGWNTNAQLAAQQQPQGNVTWTQTFDLSNLPQTTTVQAAPFSNEVIQAGGNYGVGSAGLSYVPSTGNVFMTGGVGPPSDPGVFLGAGTTTNLDQSGYTVGGSAFYGIGGGVSGNPVEGDSTTLFGVGTPGASAMTTGWTVPIGSVPAATFNMSLPTIPAQFATPLSEGVYTYNECAAFGGDC